MTFAQVDAKAFRLRQKYDASLKGLTSAQKAEKYRNFVFERYTFCDVVKINDVKRDGTIWAETIPGWFGGDPRGIFFQLPDDVIHLKKSLNIGRKLKVEGTAQVITPTRFCGHDEWNFNYRVTKCVVC